MSIIINDGIGTGGSGGGGSSTKATLFDVKTMAEAIAEKGWACLNKEANFLSKEEAPKLYDTLVDKLENAEKEKIYTSKYSFSSTNVDNVNIVVWKNNLYFDNGSGLFKSDIDLSSPSAISGGSAIGWDIVAGHNILIAFDGYSKANKITTNDTITALSGDTIIAPNSQKFNDIVIDGYIYLPCVFGNQKLYKVSDSVEATEIEQVVNFTYKIYAINKINNLWYVLTANGVYSATDITDTTTYTLLQQITISSGGASMIYSNGTFVVAYSGKVVYSSDNFATVATKTISNLNLTSKMYINNNIVYLLSSNSKVYSTTIDNLSSWEETTFGGSIGGMAFDTDIIYYICANGNIYLEEFVAKTYHDTYIINGNEVTVDYAKTQDGIKIITDLTQSSAIASVNSYLGYNNYFQVNTTTGSEGVTLPYNSNLWTYMYVGDDYEDNNLPSGNATRLLPQAEVISDSSASVSLDVKGNKDYQLSASALSSLTISSCEDSQLGTTIIFNSGATATTITDSASIDWVDGATPIPSASKTCLIFIWNKKGFYKEW